MDVVFGVDYNFDFFDRLLPPAYVVRREIMLRGTSSPVTGPVPSPGWSYPLD